MRRVYLVGELSSGCVLLKTDRFLFVAQQNKVLAFLRFLELARVLVHVDHVASLIVNADHGIM
jgi:hypothetical protein